MHNELVNHIRIRTDRAQAKDVVRALLHAVLFHRVIDTVEPETEEVFDVDIAYIPTKEIERDISAKVDEFAQAFIETGACVGELAVVFLQRKNRKGWFAVTEELVPWEAHVLTLDLAGPPAPPRLADALVQLATFCAQSRGNVPPVSGSGDQTNLSHQILISPPPPSELFAPSSPPLPLSAPLTPGRLASPAPPPGSTTSLTATAHAHAHAHAHRLAREGSAPPRHAGTHALAHAHAHAHGQAPERRAASPAGPMGYLEQAKDGLLAVGAKAGERVGWKRSAN
ncbi:hypothetical protein Q5752_006775 [Cryptotrichosporon argae]